MRHGNDWHGVALALALAGVLLIDGCATRQESDPAQVGTPSGNRDLEQFEIRCPGWERYAGLTWAR
jgi:hypothetical protein